MTKIEAIQEFGSDALLQEVCRDHLILEQQKDRRGLCIIPKDQADAAESIVAAFGKKFSYYEGSKRDCLKCYFTPELTEDEIAEIEDCV